VKCFWLSLWYLHTFCLSSFISDHRIWLIIWWVTCVTRQLQLVEQELLTRLDFTSSSAGFQYALCCLIFSFLCSVLQIIMCFFVLFLFVIELSVLLQFKTWDYPFVILKHIFAVYYLSNGKQSALNGDNGFNILIFHHIILSLWYVYGS